MPLTLLHAFAALNLEDRGQKGKCHGPSSYSSDQTNMPTAKRHRMPQLESMVLPGSKLILRGVVYRDCAVPLEYWGGVVFSLCAWTASTVILDVSPNPQLFGDLGPPTWSS
eukprot:3939816-Rhodomonas_salina.2